MTGIPKCPERPGVDDRGERRFVGSETDGPGIERNGGTWLIRSGSVARQILRQRDATRQAGFNAESLTNLLGRQPILYGHGEEHRVQRAAAARYFAPKVVNERYRSIMEAESDALIETLQRKRSVALDHETMTYAVAVARAVVGLTETPVAPMARRLERFFAESRFEQPSSLLGLLMALRGTLRVTWFQLCDVRPAIRVRRAHPQDDVVSHLIASGYNDRDILIECVTYAAAGMVTTREFIAMALWHLLDDPGLRRSYLAGEESHRYAILHEILRLEPVVGDLTRIRE